MPSSLRTIDWLSVAMELARTSPNRKWFLGAVLVDANNQLVGAGTNSISYGTDDPPFSCHAEEAALEMMIGQAYTVYVARIRRSNTIGLARPCANCTAQLRRAGVERAVWTGVDGQACYGQIG